jgi:hypothetical protein
MIENPSGTLVKFSRSFRTIATSSRSFRTIATFLTKTRPASVWINLEHTADLQSFAVIVAHLRSPGNMSGEGFSYMQLLKLARQINILI